MNNCISQGWKLIFFSIIMLLGAGSVAIAAIVSDVQATKHNLSASPDGSATPTGTVPARTVKATIETQICVYCHTPHGATSGIAAPLWNRALSGATYTPYLSGSTDANPPPGNPGTASKVCLSCHDGTLAIGTVNVLYGFPDVAISFAGTNAVGAMPDSASSTGFTRNLGIDLGNDHPISFNYDSALGGISGTDGELRSPPVVAGATTIVGNSVLGATKPTYPLLKDQIQCPTCHDPHLSDTVSTNPPLKFLRGKRLQQVAPVGGNYVFSDDIMCLACHDKAGTTWSNSAHANELVANQTYLPADASLREFPADTPVWKGSCLNCHDTHAVQGSRHLLREGTDNVAKPKAGGSPAIEQTCFQCHSDLSASIITPLATVPDIRSDYALSIRMPITNVDQLVATEAHDIGGNFDDSAATGDSNAHCNITTDRCGKDFVESQAVLGRVALAQPDLLKRHAECTDCHNPHRVTKTRLFNDDATPPITPAAAGTHKHSIAVGDTVPHDNIISGSLRGSFGVEPSFVLSSNEFGANPSGFTVKRGDGGIGALTGVSSTWVTREYQICFKCHSNFAYDTLVGPPTSVVTPPLTLGTYGGGTPFNTNGVKYYSDVAMESQAPLSHQGASVPGDSGAHANFSSSNQRSWHPVVDVTGRTLAVRGNASANLWRTPWNGSDTDIGAPIVAAVGNQTMYCSDCHGSGNASADGVNPTGGENGSSWGPHGSNNNFLLKGPWNTTTPVGIATDNLCFRCHDATQYADASGAVPNMTSGFSSPGNDAWGVSMSNLHQRHAFYTTLAGGVTTPPSMWNALPAVPWNNSYRCTMCHTGAAHGWKNKAFLVNLNDLGLELNSTGGAIGGETTLPTAVPPSTVLVASDPVPKGTQAPVVVPPAAGYTNGSYYQGAYLRINTGGVSGGFATSGNWSKNDCAGSCH